MDRPQSLGHLKPDEWERLMAYIDRFEKAWQQTVGSADGGVVLDVRTAREFSAGHLPGAFNVPLSSSSFSGSAPPTYAVKSFSSSAKV